MRTPTYAVVWVSFSGFLRGVKGVGMDEEEKYTVRGRPFRLQLSLSAEEGFDAPASRGRCQYPGCRLFEWNMKRSYCRDHWLEVHKCDRLPDRYGLR
jgi:hypothetical protein